MIDGIPLNILAPSALAGLAVLLLFTGRLVPPGPATRPPTTTTSGAPSGASRTPASVTTAEGRALTGRDDRSPTSRRLTAHDDIAPGT